MGKLCCVLPVNHSDDECAVHNVDGLEDGCCSACHCQAYQLGRVVLLAHVSLFQAAVLLSSNGHLF